MDKSNISNLVKNSDLNTKLATLATKTELKSHQEKIVTLQAFDLNYFCGKNFVGDDRFQNMSVLNQYLIRYS